MMADGTAETYSPPPQERAKQPGITKLHMHTLWNCVVYPPRKKITAFLCCPYLSLCEASNVLILLLIMRSKC
jgi:hypothetical protein